MTDGSIWPPGLCDDRHRLTRGQARSSAKFVASCLGMILLGPIAGIGQQTLLSFPKAIGTVSAPAGATRQNDKEGVSFLLPTGWRVLDSGAPTAIPGHPVLHVQSAGRGTELCSGLTAPNSATAWIIVLEFRAPPDARDVSETFRARPDGFSPKDGKFVTSEAVGDAPGDCPIPQPRRQVIRFTDHGRLLEAHVGFYVDVKARTKRMAYRILDSLRFTRRTGDRAALPVAQKSWPAREPRVLLLSGSTLEKVHALIANALRASGYLPVGIGTTTLQQGTTVACRAGHEAAAEPLAAKVRAALESLDPKVIPYPPTEPLAANLQPSEPGAADCIVVIGD